ncbi:protein of unknown function [Dethiosulfatibacter aminovorans DSM 17477]|uniref:DUF5058 domain-containing protein n=1 Tax=Dethiosulfatibacter aminovorans DSM 17477 TaxID=1121476 RepID=A0A1M6EEA9_9FIRM|nr:DUF5058 family protein [Dethiosulfatibacter aminovorans]SHI83804.1 protein of unknown function [Dethiosulfatibacter aminovorans DSM 17477]
MDLMTILNSSLLYILVAVSLLIIFGICVFFYIRGRRRAFELGVSPEVFKSSMKGAAIFSIVPSIAIIIGLISLSPLLGVPWPWFRLSVVGSLGYELMSGDLAAKGAGFESLSAFSSSNDMESLGAIMFVMSICIMTGMVCNVLFLKKIHSNATRIGSKQNPFTALALSCLVIAMMAVMLPMQLVISPAHALTAGTSAIVTYVLSYAARKYNIKWLPDFIMSFALVIGMVSGVLWSSLLI